MSSKIAGLKVKQEVVKEIKATVKVEKKKVSFKDSIFTKLSSQDIFSLIHDEIVDVIPSNILFFGKTYMMLRAFLITKKMSIYTICFLDKEIVGNTYKFDDEDWLIFRKLQKRLKEYYNIK